MYRKQTLSEDYLISSKLDMTAIIATKDNANNLRANDKRKLLIILERLSRLVSVTKQYGFCAGIRNR